MRMKALLLTAWVGNFIDMVSTPYVIRHGFMELNPVTRWLLNYPLMFVLAKQMSVTCVLYWLWHNRDDRHVLPLAIFSAAVYGTIGVYYAVCFVALS